MKKSFILLILLFVSSTIFSQKIIDKPDYGFSNLPGKLTKIELTDSATIIHFYVKYQPGYWIFIPKESYIQDVNGGEKYFVTKVEGIPLGERYTMPESGEVSYQLYFPKLNASINKVDFGEANEGGSWSIFDIVINEKEDADASLMPKPLQGNWIQTDGSNQWDFGFYAHQAIFDKAVWNYKTINQKKNNYTIVLERNGNQKTIYAQIDKKGGTSLGSDKQKMQSYSTTKTENPNYKLANDEAYSAIVFKSDSTTYSGVIKGYTPRAGMKTGTIYVNNVFTGNQDSYLVKIANDGSFSVKFPINHPQSVFVRLAGTNALVFVEPGKETFHVIDSDASLFMGDCARINTDLKALEKIRTYEEYRKPIETILETSPQDYKNACLAIKNKQTEALNEFAKKQFISQKAFQIKKLDIEFSAFLEILGYDMYREGAKRSKSQPENKLTQDYKLEASYYDFITESILKNETAVLASNYSFFINRLMNAEIFRSSFDSSFTCSRVAELLQKSGITLSNEELEMVSASKELEKFILKLGDFNYKNRSEIEDFKKNHKEAWDKSQKDNSKDNSKDFSIGDFGAYLTKQGIALTVEEKELLVNFKSASYTKEEAVIAKNFFDEYGKTQQAFFEKYDEEIKVVITENNYQKTDDKMKEVFGLNEAFAFDVIALQRKVNQMEKNLIPYTDNQLQWIQGKIKHPFLSNYIVSENNRIKAKIEANKTQSGFTINAVKKTEGDELFDSMISKFKGKVIYVDFWATWCGPCMQGIKEIAPLKEEMKNEDVVFLYITNPTSPENTWSNKIPDIKGEHYRVSQDEWNYLTQKFNISGIPHYVLVNKKGEIVNPRLGHNSNEGLKKILEEQMK